MPEPISWVVSGARLVFSAIGGAVGWLKRPKLVVMAAAEDPFVKHTSTDIPGLNAMQVLGKDSVDFFRLRVHNQGKQPARGCKVQIVGIRYVKHGVWAEIAGWEPITLKWSLKGVASTDLSPDEEAFCDVGYVVSNYLHSNVIKPTAFRVLGDSPLQHQAKFYLDAEAMPKSQVGALAHGAYSIQMKLLSNDAKTIPFTVMLNFIGAFASLAREIPEGTIFKAPAKAAEVGTVFVPLAP